MHTVLRWSVVLINFYSYLVFSFHSDMDNNVANVLAIHHNDIDLELFGLSQNKKAIMRSDDLGVTWYSVSPERYLRFLANEPEYMKKAVRVPFVKLPVNPPSRLTLNNDFVMSGNRSYVEWGGELFVCKEETHRLVIIFKNNRRDRRENRDVLLDWVVEFSLDAINSNDTIRLNSISDYDERWLPYLDNPINA